MKVHKIELMVIGADVDSADAVEIIENVNFPNDCLSVRVVSTETATIMWSDDHPLNKARTWRQAFRDLFR